MARNRWQSLQGNNPTALTSRAIGELLPKALAKIGYKYQGRPELVLAVWPDIIGAKLAVMTEAISFQSGFLTVRVKNSTLYSLLSQNDKPRILKLLRAKCPGVLIKNIVFRMG